jgi:predicted RNA binding protein with dsRBD fold (UPF0201 family)
MFLLRVEAEVRPTESEERVAQAIRNVVDVEVRVVDVGGGYRVAVGESTDVACLRRLHTLLRQERILDAARAYSMRSRRGNTLELKLHKQAAYAGHVSFVTYDDESPLGPIRITIVSDKLDEVLDWLAPPTSQGRPIWEKPMPSV